MLISLWQRIGVRRPPILFYRYILSEITKPFLGAALFFLFVLLMFQVIRLSDFFVIHNVSGFSILSLMWSLALTFMPVIFPIAFLLAVLMGFGRLSGDGEVLAMRSAGLSVVSMLWPTMALGILLSIITLICNFYFVPYGSKMDDEGKARALRVYASGLIAATTGVAGAGGNVMLSIFGGQDVYANFAAGEDLDLIPPQVIAHEAGLTVWGMDRKLPVWHVRKQPFIVAPSPEIAERFLQAAGI